MVLATGIEKIKNTSTGNTKVEVEFVSCDLARRKAGVLKNVVGRIAKSSHDGFEHGTLVLVDDQDNYHTIHVALLMKINREFVD